jgi:cell division protein FtsL
MPQTARKLKPQVAPRKRQQLRVVKAKTQLRMPDLSSMFSFLLVAAVMMAGILIFNVSQRALIAQGALQNERLRSAYEKEQIKHQTLLMTKTELSAPDRIEQIAVEKLGMTNPCEVSYLELPTDVHGSRGATASNRVSDQANSWQKVKDRIAGEIGMSALSN